MRRKRKRLEPFALEAFIFTEHALNVDAQRAPALRLRANRCYLSPYFTLQP